MSKDGKHNQMKEPMDRTNIANDDCNHRGWSKGRRNERMDDPIDR